MRQVSWVHALSLAKGSSCNRQTRSGASFSPYHASSVPSTREIVRAMAESGREFGEAAQREDTNLRDEGTASERPPCASSLHIHQGIPSTELQQLLSRIVGPQLTPSAASSSGELSPTSSLQQLPRQTSHKNAGSKRRRSEKRRAAALAKGAAPSAMGLPVKASTARKHREANKIPSLLRLDALPHAGGGSWIGLREGGSKCRGPKKGSSQGRPPTLEELLATKKFRYVAYQPG